MEKNYSISCGFTVHFPTLISHRQGHGEEFRDSELQVGLHLIKTSPGLNIQGRDYASLSGLGMPWDHQTENLTRIWISGRKWMDGQHVVMNTLHTANKNIVKRVTSPDIKDQPIADGTRSVFEASHQCWLGSPCHLLFINASLNERKGGGGGSHSFNTLYKYSVWWLNSKFWFFLLCLSSKIHYLY